MIYQQLSEIFLLIALLRYSSGGSHSVIRYINKASSRNAMIDRDNPIPRIKNAGERSNNVRTSVFLPTGLSVLHFLASGKYFFFT